MPKVRTIRVVLNIRTDAPLSAFRRRSGWSLLLAAWLGHLKKSGAMVEVDSVAVEPGL